jgi:hypothetical protein
MATIAEGIHWLGIIVALVQLGIASFLLVEACLSVCAKVPKTFNVGKSHLIPDLLISLIPFHQAFGALFFLAECTAMLGTQ